MRKPSGNNRRQTENRKRSRSTSVRFRQSGDCEDEDDSPVQSSLTIEYQPGAGSTTIQFKKRLSFMSVIAYLICIRYIANNFPYGMLRSSNYDMQLDSTGPKVLFTLQQHVWSLIPFLFGSAPGLAKTTIHQLLITIILATSLREVYMKYISALIISSSIFTLFGTYSGKNDWTYFFTFPRKVVNFFLTLLCILYAMDTRPMSGFKY